MPKYITKPAIKEAVQWTGGNYDPLMHYFNWPLEFIKGTPHGYLIINTLEGPMKAEKNDYIIKGIKGEFYPCKPDIFEASYDLVEEKPE